MQLTIISGDNGTCSVLLMSSQLRDFVLVVVIAEKITFYYRIT